MGTHPIFESDFDCLTVMSSGDRLKGLLNDFKKSGSTSVNIGNDTGDDEATQGLLGGISGWTNSGFSKFKSSMTKVSDSLPTSVKNLTETSGFVVQTSRRRSVLSFFIQKTADNRFHVIYGDGSSMFFNGSCLSSYIACSSAKICFALYSWFHIFYFVIFILIWPQKAF